MKTDQIVRQYLWLTGIFNFGVSMSLATYVAFLISRGLNLFEVNLVNVAFFATMFLCEIPTGAFADTFGRKRSYVISCFLFSIGEIVYSQATGMAGFLLAEILAGVGRTFANGAYHAWLVDTLRHHGFQGSTKPVFRKEQMVRQFVSIPGAIIGSYVGSYDLSYPWLLGGVIGIASGTLALISMKEEYFVKRKARVLESVKEMLATAKKGIAMSGRSAPLRFLLVISMSISFSVQALNMQWQPFFGEGVRTAHFGYIWAGISLAIFLGMHYSLRFSERFGSEKVALVSCCVLSGLGMVAAALAKDYVALSLAIFLLHEIPRGAYVPLKEAFLNDSIEDRERATIISCQSAFTHLACLSGLFLSGVVANQASIGTAWIMSGVVVAIVPLLALRLKPV
ncbi:MAG: MFS transporter [Candidatus Taylorbacteria bacterium]|nr:MFS transporter [Candidatus Taylorbacteria bacterium]